MYVLYEAERVGNNKKQLKYNAWHVHDESCFIQNIMHFLNYATNFILICSYCLRTWSSSFGAIECCIICLRLSSDRNMSIIQSWFMRLSFRSECNIINCTVNFLSTIRQKAEHSFIESHVSPQIIKKFAWCRAKKRHT